MPMAIKQYLLPLMFIFCMLSPNFGLAQTECEDLFRARPDSRTINENTEILRKIVRPIDVVLLETFHNWSHRDGMEFEILREDLFALQEKNAAESEKWARIVSIARDPNVLGPRMTVYKLAPSDPTQTSTFQSDIKAFATSMLIRGSYSDFDAIQKFSVGELDTQAKIQGMALAHFDTAYRIDTRAPDEIVAAKGFWPDPTKVLITFYEHVFRLSPGGGSFVSVGQETNNVQVADMVASHAMKKFGWWDPNRPDHIKLYEYKIKSVVGVQPSPEFAAAGEKEVVTVGISESQIDSYREIVVSEKIVDHKQTYSVQSTGDWKKLSP